MIGLIINITLACLTTNFYNEKLDVDHRVNPDHKALFGD